MHRVHAKWKCTVCKYFYLPECKHRVECPLCSPSVVAGLSLLQFPWWNPHNRSNSSIFGGSPLKKFTSFFFQFNTLSSTIIYIYISEDTNRASVLHSIHRWKDILVIFFFNSSIFSSPSIRKENTIIDIQIIRNREFRDNCEILKKYIEESVAKVQFEIIQKMISLPRRWSVQQRIRFRYSRIRCQVQG